MRQVFFASADQSPGTLVSCLALLLQGPPTAGRGNQGDQMRYPGVLTEFEDHERIDP
jgi:hypothetical protein